MTPCRLIEESSGNQSNNLFFYTALGIMHHFCGQKWQNFLFGRIDNGQNGIQILEFVGRIVLFID